jgi:hypothetical protein
MDHEGVKIDWDFGLFPESTAELTNQEAAANPIGIAPQSTTPDSSLSLATVPESAAAAQPKKNAKKPKIKRRYPGAKRVLKPTPLAADAPAPHTNTVIQKNGAKPTARALEAWAARVRGAHLVDVAHEMGVSIEEAKALMA